MSVSSINRVKLRNYKHTWLKYYMANNFKKKLQKIELTFFYKQKVSTQSNRNDLWAKYP